MCAHVVCLCRYMIKMWVSSLTGFVFVCEVAVYQSVTMYHYVYDTQLV